MKPEKKLGTFGEALSAAGVKSPESAAQRLRRLTIKAIKDNDTEDGAAEQLWLEIRNDVQMLVEILQPTHKKFLLAHIRSLKNSCAAQRGSGGVTVIPLHTRRPWGSNRNPKPSASRDPIPEPRHAPDRSGIVTSIMQRALLKTFMVNGQPIGDLTPRECRGWASKRQREGIFVARLIAGVPEHRRIKQHISEDDAQRIWNEVEKEII